MHSIIDRLSGIVFRIEQTRLWAWATASVIRINIRIFVLLGVLLPTIPAIYLLAHYAPILAVIVVVAAIIFTGLPIHLLSEEGRKRTKRKQ